MIGQTLSHYKIIDRLGSGGMGVVYKARDLMLDRTVALKFLPPDLVRDPEAKQRFVHEAKAASALDHQNVCTIHEISETPEGQIFIVMGFYQGETLKEKIEHGPLDIESAVDIATQAARGLSRAHRHDIVHRDIKTGNLIVTADGVVKILDFGLAKLSGRSLLTKPGSTLGTIAYMSPEQAQGADVDARTDIWSLGVVLFEMLTGKLPFRGEHDAAMLYSIVNEKAEDLASLRPDVPRELAQIVERALMKKPGERYPSADEMVRDLETFRGTPRPGGEAADSLGPIVRKLLRPAIGVPIALVLIAIGALAVWYAVRSENVHRARTELLPRVQTLAEEGVTSYAQAFLLAEEAERYIPGDSALAELLSRVSTRISVRSIPPGARILMKEFAAPDSAFTFAGITPIESLRVPAGFLTARMEKEGFEPVLAAFFAYEIDWRKPGFFTPGALSRTLDSSGNLPAGMVRIPGIDSLPGVGKIGDFFMDRCEVTNRAFKEFVDAGGYNRREFWTDPFNRNGKAVSWEDAMKEFVDQSGQPGPATWQAGEYPTGEDDFPVSGISWYEAAAFARYAGKTLPTTHHWEIARGGYTSMIRSKHISTFLTPMSNFGGSGPAAVRTHLAISPFGCYDMAGNVREWCLNETAKGRIVRGGAWNDIPYMFGNVSQASPFDRSPKNGFRCALYPEGKSIPKKAFQPVELGEEPDFYKMRPVSDQVFRIYRDQFSYDRGPLDATVEWRNDSSPGWIQEKISFNAAYGHERVPLYLFLPRNLPPPYQTVVYFPGSGSVYQRSSKDLERFGEFARHLRFLVNSGRAVAYPVYQGTFERGSDEFAPIHDGDTTHRYSTYLTELVKDFRRSLDYLETRQDIDAKKFAYLGFSWGGMYAAIIPAVEDRLGASIAMVGGLVGFARPEASDATYIGRVRVPTLMLNGRYDLTFPLETSVKPMFDLMGTPPGDKKLVLYDTDHFIPRNGLIKETLAWLDRYLGPVER